jgi:hypothetical protein
MHCLPPFKVNYWLNDGDIISLKERELLVIRTPGEATDYISLLDKKSTGYHSVATS